MIEGYQTKQTTVRTAENRFRHGEQTADQFVDVAELSFTWWKLTKARGKRNKE